MQSPSQTVQKSYASSSKNHSLKPTAVPVRVMLMVCAVTGVPKSYLQSLCNGPGTCWLECYSYQPLRLASQFASAQQVFPGARGPSLRGVRCWGECSGARHGRALEGDRLGHAGRHCSKGDMQGLEEVQRALQCLPSPTAVQHLQTSSHLPQRW